MKKRLLIIIIYIFIFGFCTSVYAAPTTYTRTENDLRLPYDISANDVNIQDVLKTASVDEKEKIYDFANVLSEAEETKIYIQLNEYIKNTGLDAVIIITNDLKGYGMNDYTHFFYDYNNFKDMGVAFTIYAGADRTSIYMSRFGPLKSEVYGAYSDKAIEAILKRVYDDHMRSQDYVGACIDYVKLIDGFYYKAYGSYRVGEEKDVIAFPWIEVLVVSVALSFIIVVLVITKYQKPIHYTDKTIKNALNETSTIVKCESDKPYSEKKEN